MQSVLISSVAKKDPGGIVHDDGPGLLMHRSRIFESQAGAGYYFFVFTVIFVIFRESSTALHLDMVPPIT